ncbi:hypothetical protein E1301_Tti017448 [Triplophysa tibetana]|uniref:Podoplanin n=1 Tax=Triplophysa tibetana TaxID=1572043 RepID=A0A5A9NYV0_9TELE|nr:hypothetical protein E1301_Tti017448 [Triplophysa tibetana]
MTRIILLLLVALTGPFCTFTRASTIVVPTATNLDTTGVNESNEPSVTEKVEEQAPLSTGGPLPDATDVPVTSTDAPVVSTEAQVQSEAPTETDVQTDTTTSAQPETEELFHTTTIDEGGAISDELNQTESETSKNGVLIDEEEATGTGALVGIVIGALIAVIVVIAVIILVVRRMGQYSDGGDFTNLSLSLRRKHQKTLIHDKLRHDCSRMVVSGK